MPYLSSACFKDACLRSRKDREASICVLNSSSTSNKEIRSNNSGGDLEFLTFECRVAALSCPSNESSQTIVVDVVRSPLGENMLVVVEAKSHDYNFAVSSLPELNFWVAGRYCWRLLRMRGSGRTLRACPRLSNLSGTYILT